MVGCEIVLSETARKQFERLLNEVKPPTDRASTLVSRRMLDRIRLLMKRLRTTALGEDRRMLPDVDMFWLSEESTHVWYLRLPSNATKVYVLYMCEADLPQAGDVLLGLIETGQINCLALLGINAVTLPANHMTQMQ